MNTIILTMTSLVKDTGIGLDNALFNDYVNYIIQDNFLNMILTPKFTKDLLTKHMGGQTNDNKCRR